MFKNGKKDHCEFSDGLLDYLYSEMGMADPSGFETHITRCAACAAELASLSSARHSVIEWRREEFDRLKTPEIVIPDLASSIEQATHSPAFFDLMRAFFAGHRWPVAAFIATGLLLALAGISLIYREGAGPQIAANTAPAVTELQPPLTVPAISTPGSPVSPTLDRSMSDVTESVLRSKSRKPASRVVATGRDRRVAVKPAAAPRSKAPTLTDFEDSEDTSLRLTDLFADSGVSQ